MKAKIHPTTANILFKNSKGEELKILTTLTSKESRLIDADYFSHPAWTGNSKNTSFTDNIKNMSKKHEGFEDL